MNNFFNRVEKAEQARMDQHDYNMSRRASAYEHFAGEFADTGISFQNLGGFILPLNENGPAIGHTASWALA